MDISKIDLGFNNIKPWLTQKLAERRLSVDRFCVASGSTINPTAIRRWYSDRYRPYPEVMKRVCENLSRLPIILDDGSKYLEHVPWSEGLAQYVPKPRAWAAHYLNKPTPEQKKTRKLR